MHLYNRRYRRWGPLPVVRRVITPLLGVLTPVTGLFSAIYSDTNGFFSPLLGLWVGTLGGGRLSLSNKDPRSHVGM